MAVHPRPVLPGVAPVGSGEYEGDRRLAETLRMAGGRGQGSTEIPGPQRDQGVCFDVDVVDTPSQFVQVCADHVDLDVVQGARAGVGSKGHALQPLGDPARETDDVGQGGGNRRRSQSQELLEQPRLVGEVESTALPDTGGRVLGALVVGQGAHRVQPLSPTVWPFRSPVSNATEMPSPDGGTETRHRRPRSMVMPPRAAQPPRSTSQGRPGPVPPGRPGET